MLSVRWPFAPHGNPYGHHLRYLGQIVCLHKCSGWPFHDLDWQIFACLHDKVQPNHLMQYQVFRSFLKAKYCIDLYSGTTRPTYMEQKVSTSVGVNYVTSSIDVTHYFDFEFWIEKEINQLDTRPNLWPRHLTTRWPWPRISKVWNSIIFENRRLNDMERKEFDVITYDHDCDLLVTKVRW